MEIGLLFINWFCVEASECLGEGDVSNIFSTIVGIIIGAFISWLIYNRQEKTTNKQEHILEKIQAFEKKHDKMLKNILIVHEKLDSLLENKKKD